MNYGCTYFWIQLILVYTMPAPTYGLNQLFYVLCLHLLLIQSIVASAISVGTADPINFCIN